MYWSYSFDYNWLISPGSEWLKSPDANKINKIGIFNPRLYKVYLYDMNNYSKELYKEIERDVICYNN